MKSHSAEIIAAGLACAVLGFFRCWTLVQVAVSLPGVAVGNRLNAEIWLFFVLGVAGVATSIVGFVAHASGKNQENPR